MLTGRIKAQIVAFVVLGLLATSYLGLKYVGLDPFSTGYTVTATLPAAGGAFENGQVTYRGVPVGRIDRAPRSASSTSTCRAARPVARP